MLSKISTITIAVLGIALVSLFGIYKYQMNSNEVERLKLVSELKTEKELSAWYKTGFEGMLKQFEKEKEADEVVKKAHEDIADLDLRIDHILQPMEDVESSSVLKETMRELRK